MQGVTLTIEPGVVIKFNSERSLQIDGEIIARGTENNTIIFTSNQLIPGPGDWGYITFSDSSIDANSDIDGNYISGSILEYCTFEYAGGGSVGNNGALRLHNAHPFINYCNIQSNSATGIYAWNITGNFMISNSTIKDNTGINTGGIYVYGSNHLIFNNLITNNKAISGGNSGGICVIDGNSSIYNNIITYNTTYSGGKGGGIYVDSISNIKNNLISNNTANGGSGGGIYLYHKNATIENNIISENVADNGGGINVNYYYSDPTVIFSNNYVINNTAEQSGGGIQMQGMGWGGRMTITNNIIYGNQAMSGIGGGIGARKYTTIKNNLISHNKATNSTAVHYGWGVGDELFQYNTIRYNREFGIEPTYTIYISGPPIFNFNNIFENIATFDLWNGNAYGSENVDARNNWWNTELETKVLDKIHDWFDDSTKGITDYAPWDTAIRVDTPISSPKGLRITENGESFKIEWDANPESDVAGYKVYWDTDSDYHYSNMADVGNDTTHNTSEILTPFIVFTVTAYDNDYSTENDLQSTIVNENQTNGNESWYAEPVFIKGAGKLEVTPSTDFDSSGFPGGPFDPPNIIYTLKNTGDNYINWIISKEAFWINLSQSNGSLELDEAIEITAFINQSANDLPLGAYYDTLAFKNTTNADGDTDRKVSLLIGVEPSEITCILSKNNITLGETFQISGQISPAPTEAGAFVDIEIISPNGQSLHKTSIANSLGEFTYNSACEDFNSEGTWSTRTSWNGDLNLTGATSSDQTIEISKAESMLTLDITPQGIKKGDLTSISCKITPQPECDRDLSGISFDLVITDPDGVLSIQTVQTNDQGGHFLLENYGGFGAVGEWSVQASFDGNDAYLSSSSNTVQVRVVEDAGRAIILGGGYAEQTNTFWNVTKKLTISAYRDFKAKGFTDDMICFMIHSQIIDIDYDDIADPVVDIYPPTANGFTSAIRSYFVSDLDSDTPLFIFMQGHATSDKRFRVLGSDEYVTAQEIKDALDKLQGVGNYQGENGLDCPVVIIIESCFSGKFIPDLSAPNRIIFTSAGDEQYNTDSSGNISFSRFLFSKLREGDSLKKAFDYSKNYLTNMGYPSPRMDDNGDGVSDSSDGLFASSLYLFGPLLWGSKPEIQEIVCVSTLEIVNSTPITVKVIQGDVAIDRVWVQVIPPNANITGGEDTIIYPQVELSLNTETGNYEGTLTDIGKVGIYKIVVLAKDVSHEVSSPKIAYITVKSVINPEDINGDRNIDLIDVVMALKVLCGVNIGDGIINLGADINNDDKIGLEEAIYVLQIVSGVRFE